MDFGLKVAIILAITAVVLIFGATYADHNHTANMASRHYIYVKGWYPDVILKGTK